MCNPIFISMVNAPEKYLYMRYPISYPVEIYIIILSCACYFIAILLLWKLLLLLSARILHKHCLHALITRIDCLNEYVLTTYILYNHSLQPFSTNTDYKHRLYGTDCMAPTARHRLHGTDCTAPTARHRLHDTDCTTPTARH